MLVEETKRAWQALGKTQYGPIEAEKKSMVFRRSRCIAEDMKAGDVLTREKLCSIRPGHGLPPKYYDILLGKKVTRGVKRGTLVGWELIG